MVSDLKITWAHNRGSNCKWPPADSSLNFCSWATLQCWWFASATIFFTFVSQQFWRWSKEQRGTRVCCLRSSEAGAAFCRSLSPLSSVFQICRLAKQISRPTCKGEWHSRVVLPASGSLCVQTPRWSLSRMSGQKESRFKPEAKRRHSV